MGEISVIIPAYNCEETIEKTIKSIVCQSFLEKKIEIIVINDGSVDRTKEIINAWTDNPQFVIRHTQNQGASAARELGRHLAKGQYIQYLDSDDLLLPHKLAQQVDALVRESADIAYGNWQKFRESADGLEPMETLYPDHQQNPVLSTFTTFWCPPAALLFTKAIADKIGPWPQNLPIIQDARYLQNAAMAGAKFVKTEEVVALYRVSEQSLSTRHGELKFYLDVYHNTLDIWEIWKTSYPEPIYRQTIVETLRNCAKVFIHHDRNLFETCTTQLLAIQPHYIPAQSLSMRVLSQLLGFRKASIFAHQVKSMRGKVRGT